VLKQQHQRHFETSRNKIKKHSNQVPETCRKIIAYYGYFLLLLTLSNLVGKPNDSKAANVIDFVACKFC